MAATSGRVPMRLLAAVTATSLVRSDNSSSYWAVASSPLSRSTSAQRTTCAGTSGGLHPRPHVRVVVEPGHDHLVSRCPAPRKRLGEPVGEGGHVRSEDHPVAVTPDEIGYGSAAVANDLSGTLAGRKGSSQVAEPGR